MALLINGMIGGGLINLFLLLSYCLSFYIIGGLYNVTQLSVIGYIAFAELYISCLLFIALPWFFLKHLLDKMTMRVSQLIYLFIASLFFSFVLFSFLVFLLLLFDPSSAVAVGYMGLPILFVLFVIIGHIIALFYGLRKLAKGRD